MTLGRTAPRSDAGCPARRCAIPPLIGREPVSPGAAEEAPQKTFRRLVFVPDLRYLAATHFQDIIIRGAAGDGWSLASCLPCRPRRASGQ